jgi:hypothetical protein
MYSERLKAGGIPEYIAVAKAFGGAARQISDAIYGRSKNSLQKTSKTKPKINYTDWYYFYYL